MKFEFSFQIVLAFSSVALLPGVAQAFAPVSIEINESGQPPLWSIDVDVRTGSALNVVTPNGTLLEPKRWFDGSITPGWISYEETFETMDSALSFVSGEWSLTRAENWYSEPELSTEKFFVDSITGDDLNRSVPIVSSPANGFEAQNGKAFLLAWDHETLSGEAPDRHVIFRQRTAPQENGSSRSISTTPSGAFGGGSGSTGALDFRTSISAEWGAESDRWLFTASSNEALPQTFDIRVGSYLSMDEFLDTPLEDQTNPDSDPLVSLTYSRYADTIGVTLVHQVTEPTCVIPADGIVGDFNGNGTVGFRDFLTLSDNFGQEVSTYEEGDANCDGAIGFDDFLAVSNTYGQTVAAAPVPEPSTFALTMFSIGILVVRPRSSTARRRTS